VLKGEVEIMTHPKTQEIPIAQLMISPFNTRRQIGDVSDLAASIRSIGLLQPIVVRPAPDDGHYEVVAGSRRMKACQSLGWETITAVVRSLTDRQALLLSLSENIQQQTLDPIERAEGVQRLVDDFAQEMPRTEAMEVVARQMGKNKATIYQWLALLRTTEAVRRMVRERKVVPKLAARLSSLPEEKQEPVARAVAEEDLTRTDALRVVRLVEEQPSVSPQQAVARVRQEALEEVSVTVSFPGNLYRAVADKAKEEHCSIQEVVRRASKAYVRW
jgi:ParB family chromosome partitioning protein